jgi:hypothetical protein
MAFASKGDVPPDPANGLLNGRELVEQTAPGVLEYAEGGPTKRR